MSCGGAGGGPGPEGAGQGLTLLYFDQANVGNVPLNRILTFEFSEPVDPATIGPANIHIREGPSFGLTVQGEFIVSGSRVQFLPRLPALRLEPGGGNECDLSVAGFKPGRTYRIQLIGHPEHAAIHNTRGQPLDVTNTVEFSTRESSDPGLLQDAAPDSAPYVVESTPADGTPRVPVGSSLKIGDGEHVRFEGPRDEIRIVLSENIHPCSLDHSTVRVYAHEQGDASSGFVPEQDADPSNPYSWGSGTASTLTPARRVPCRILLDQTFDSTILTLRPAFGRLPENALIAVDLTSGILDFGGISLVPQTIAFTTENKPESRAMLRVEYDESTPIDPDGKTATVDSARAPSWAQGFLSVAGDGDNGPEQNVPAFPAQLQPAFCESQDNDGLDHFHPDDDFVLDTGATLNACRNDVDGSYAVVWEFSSFTIENGITVSLAGVNPAIILVTGPVLIKPGGVLTLAGAPGKNGATSTSARGLPFPKGAAGGQGVAGGGDGGSSQSIASVHPRPDGDYYGKDGWAGYGSPDHDGDAEGGRGAGEGNTAAGFIGPFPTLGTSSAAGGGGGHAERGEDGGANKSFNNGWLAAEVRGAGGGTYPDSSSSNLMLLPSAGSGGGAAGYCDCVASASGHHPGCTASGGAGGAGGGFVDITSGTSITVQGTIDASGGRGGQGGVSYYIDIGDTGGGGGGSGGGIRLMTPGDIDVTDGTITAAGGPGGVGLVSMWNGGAAPNHGGSGSNGRIVLEDSDGVITGQSSANITPSEGEPGFHRGRFQESRFRGGGVRTMVATRPMFLGPLSKTRLLEPAVEDFRAGVPVGASRGLNATAVLVEIQGYPLNPDGTMDTEAPTGWWTVGSLRDSGTTHAPTWVSGVNPVDVQLPDDNAGVGIQNVDGMGFVQIRLTFYVPENIAVGFGGPYVDRFDLRFEYDDL